MAELKATRFEWEERATTLLDEVGLISGVSGGSVLATYYAAFGDEVFTRFEPDFLLVNFQGGLIRDLMMELRRHLLYVPTALTILPIQVSQLQQAGRQVLRESPAVQRLRQSLNEGRSLQEAGDRSAGS